MKFKHFVCEEADSPYFIPVMNSGFSTKLAIEEVGESFFHKRCFTAKQAFGKDLKVIKLTAADKLSPNLVKYPYFWVDDGSPDLIYRFNKTTSGRYEVLKYKRDYKFGHHNMLNRGHLELTAFDDAVDEDILEDSIRNQNLKLTFDGLGVHKLKALFDDVTCNDEAKRIEIDNDDVIIDSIAYHQVLYAPDEKALYILANIEFTFKQVPAKPQESRDMVARKEVGEDFKLIDTLRVIGDVIDVTRFFRGGVPGA